MSEEGETVDWSGADMGEHQLTLAVAAVLPVILGISLRANDETMNAAAARAIQFVFEARDGDPDSERFVIDCLQRLRDGVRMAVTQSADARGRPN